MFPANRGFLVYLNNSIGFHRQKSLGNTVLDSLRLVFFSFLSPLLFSVVLLLHLYLTRRVIISWSCNGYWYAITMSAQIKPFKHTFLFTAIYTDFKTKKTLFTNVLLKQYTLAQKNNLITRSSTINSWADSLLFLQVYIASCHQSKYLLLPHKN